MCVFSLCCFCSAGGSCWCYATCCVGILCTYVYIFFCKQKPAYEMRISDWSSDVCSSDLSGPAVVDGIKANDSGHREVNPVKASLVVFNGDTRLAAAKPMTLERGKVYSLFVTGTTASPVLTWVVN